MKKFVMLVFTLAICSSSIAQEINSCTGTFSGLTDDYYFKFIDTKNNSIIFNEIDNEVTVDLFDDEAIGNKFKITWEVLKIELTDENEEPTGETESGKRIVTMKEIPKEKL